jgi:hypothetical protein
MHNLWALLFHIGLTEVGEHSFPQTWTWCSLLSNNWPGNGSEAQCRVDKPWCIYWMEWASCDRTGDEWHHVTEWMSPSPLREREAQYRWQDSHLYPFTSISNAGQNHVGDRSKDTQCLGGGVAECEQPWRGFLRCCSYVTSSSVWQWSWCVYESLLSSLSLIFRLCCMYKCKWQLWQELDHVDHLPLSLTPIAEQLNKTRITHMCMHTHLHKHTAHTWAHTRTHMHSHTHVHTQSNMHTHSVFLQSKSA